jgi:transposase
MMGERQSDQGALFYEFSLERHVAAGHMLRSIDRFVDLGEVRAHLAPFYSSTGRPSVDPELLIRMLIVGYCYGIRSERRLCEEVQDDHSAARSPYSPLRHRRDRQRELALQ